ncbi:hypothetical protein EWF20_10250 [Sulfolobus sp. S-194]|uniref:AAA family ATPase n=1 Tax=Sulfolobus sp. S-194 TaxID=2512240 RepID=UPI001436FF46|nr:AAA family ATPase [Sulfolobus sp. S-194]QIW24492.1 hypothetical protein EWF20_10250 [Sulfolobus sp. S-194]
MRLKISLGPISDAYITLGDLTVFFGPPNSGKSITLNSLYYLLKPPPLSFSFSSNGNKFEAYSQVLTVKGEVNENKINFEYLFSNDYLKSLLPEGKLEVEPFSFIDFAKNKAIYVSYSANLPNPALVLPLDCKINEIENINYEVKIAGGKGVINFSAEGIVDQCKNLVYMEIAKNIINAFADYLFSEYKKLFYDELYKREGIKDVLPIPYWRPFITHELLATEGSILKILKAFGIQLADSPVLLDYLNRISEAKINSHVYKLLQPLISGSIEPIGNKVVYKEDGKVIPLKFASASIMEILSILLSVREKDLILYEEPETQFHEKFQLVISIILYALTNTNKIVITTHSQTIIYTLSFLALLKPSAEDISNLFKSIGLKDYEYLAKEVEKANTKTIKFYYFHDGKVEEKTADDVSEGIQGVQDIMNKEFEWFSTLYQRKIWEK